MPPSRHTKKTRSSLTKIQCKKICVYTSKHPGKSQTEIASFFNIQWAKNMDRSTISRILKKKKEFLAIEDNSVYALSKCSRQVKVPQLNEALRIWVGQALSSRMFISDAILKEKAVFFAHELASAPLETLSQEKEWLQRILRQYNPDDIYNADETGLFFRMFPNETLAQEPVSRTKK
ncbi:6188_t:CDS:2, partial [Rhizophagus irregularis]